MFSFGAVTFLSPWILGALVIVPVLWWILRVTPPAPASMKLPTFFLLKDIKTEIKAAARTPWWLLLIRALLVMCFIFALSDPVLRLTRDLPGSGGDVLIVIDNGWAAAANWRARTDRIREYLPRIKRAGRAVVFVPTAPNAGDGKLHASDVMPAEEAGQWLDRLKPMPWPADYAAAAVLAEGVVHDSRIGHTLFFSDGLAAGPDFLERLQRGGGLTLIRDDGVNDPVILRGNMKKPGELSFGIERLVAARRTDLSLVAYDGEGKMLDEHRFSLPAGQRTAEVNWDIVKEMRGQVVRVALRAPQMASATYLADARWRQHSVGIVADAGSKSDDGFLNEIYYLRRALETGGEPGIDNLNDLIKRPLSAIVWPDSAALTAVERVNLLKWVEDGGFLIRFAGPNLAANTDDPLLPVTLRYGQRAMQGALTWEKPVHLGAIGEDSPLYGFEVPEDVTVTRQVLASPTPEVFEKTWLQLEDGTPLVTGGHVGKGVIVLVHTTAGPDWSDFCYSGLYVESLRRMISLSAGVSEAKGTIVLSPALVMDGFGHLQPPDPQGVAAAIDSRAGFSPSPVSPPGLYGGQEDVRAFNLGEALPEMQALGNAPSMVDEESYDLSGEQSLKPDFFQAALWLLLVDMLATLWLRGVLHFRRAAGVILMCALLGAAPARAQEIPEADLVSGIYLAYVETGDYETDRISHNGLSGLQSVITARTNIRVRGVRGVDPAIDPLFYYPFLYWPMTQAQTALSATAARNLQNYMGQGGLVLIDTRDGQFGRETGGATIGTQRMRKLTENIRIAELAPVGEGHILTKSFYLLDNFPGLYAGGHVWAEKEPSPNFDAVTAVIIGGNDWAAAWSADPGDRARYAVMPGGEKQREMAYRFGVNLVMTALAGNYKADRVHVPYILERLGK